MIKVLLVGGGAREDAICRKLVEDGASICSAASNMNPSISALSRGILVTKETDENSIFDFAVRNEVDLAFVSPDSALDTNLVDRFMERGIRVASPGRSAAKIETSKAFMRDLVDKHQIPGQIDHRLFTSENGLLDYFQELDGSYVIKPIGLTGGKGVKVKGDHFRTDREGLEIASKILRSDSSVLIERKATGEEFSLQAFCDGSHLSFMPVAQDYKRAFENDEGPNTGGMGSITSYDHSLPFLSPGCVEKAKSILKQIAGALQKDGHEFHGILYGQFMDTGSDTVIIEVNARFADPEGINAIFLMEGSLLETLFGIADGSLQNQMKFTNMSTVLKYVVPTGYGSSPKATELHVDYAKFPGNPRVYYASVNGSLSNVKTTSSRALAVIAMSAKIWDASEKAESSLSAIKGDYSHRRDIGTKESIERKTKFMETLRS